MQHVYKLFLHWEVKFVFVSCQPLMCVYVHSPVSLWRRRRPFWRRSAWTWVLSWRLYREGRWRAREAESEQRDSYRNSTHASLRLREKEWSEMSDSVNFQVEMGLSTKATTFIVFRQGYLTSEFNILVYGKQTAFRFLVGSREQHLMLV